MKRILLKTSAFCMAGLIIAAASHYESVAATMLSEKPLAGISLSLESYYDAVLINPQATLKAASLPEEENPVAYTFMGDVPIGDLVAAMEDDAGEPATQEELPPEPEQEEPESTTEEDMLEDLRNAYDNLGIATVDNYLNIREKPGEDQKIIGKLSKNSGCNIYSVDEDGWAKIKSGKVTGYVMSSYLTTGEEAMELAKKVGIKTATVNTTTLKVREKPDTESICLTLVPNGEEYDVIKETDEWVKIVVDNDKGWISKEYVDLSYQLKKAVFNTEVESGGTTGVSSTRASIVSYSKQFLGNPYVWGGTSLTNGADCSGFTMSLYRQFGVSINRTSGAQMSNGRRISYTQARPGDLIFYSSNGRINHVAMYIGSGQVIHASNPRTGIKISNMTYRTPAGAVSILD